MRPSNKNRILEAAFRVIERDGVTGVTFDSVAAEANLTRGGLTYHYPSRESLIEAIHAHLASKWEERMLAETGKSYGETSANERFAAYARACAQSATRAELLFMLDATTSPELASAWADIPDKWAPSAPEKDADSETLARFIARLAADGLWVYESISLKPLSSEVKEKVVKELTRIFESGNDSGRDGGIPPR